MFWISFARLMAEVGHKAGLCNCEGLIFSEPCRIGLEERAERRRQQLFQEWDALGLGYVGPTRLG